MRAVILSTGDELTTGRTLDTNAHYISDQLVAIGIDVVGMLVVGDYPERIAWAWRQALAQADVVLCTGGLGPTADDLTTETVASVAGVGLRMEEAVADRIRQMFAAMGRTMPENNLKQELFPEGATIITLRTNGERGDQCSSMSCMRRFLTPIRATLAPIISRGNPPVLHGASDLSSWPRGRSDDRTPQKSVRGPECPSTSVWTSPRPSMALPASA